MRNGSVAFELASPHDSAEQILDAMPRVGGHVTVGDAKAGALLADWAVARTEGQVNAPEPIRAPAMPRVTPT